MTLAEDKAERNIRADRQEQEEVAEQRGKGNLAWRLDKEVDTIVFTHTGTVWLTDCKYSDNDVFYADFSDVDKGLDAVRMMSKCLGRYGVPIQFRLDMHFPRHKGNNRKYIPLTEDCRHWSLKITRTAERITCLRVRKGKHEIFTEEADDEVQGSQVRAFTPVRHNP